ncbi:uncharacterized protein [Dysidea avara]
MLLTEHDLKELFPGKIGIVKKLCAHQAKVENDKISSSLALKMKNESTPLSNTQSKIAAYKLPIKKVMVNESKGVAKCVVGTPIPSRPVIEKVLMLVGATGAGKTTLINGMINYLFGVKWKDDFRLVLIAEDLVKSQAHSQTALITAYTIYPSEGSQFEYALTIIDTPGFGDTTGLERDKQIIQQIQNFFSIKGENGIDNLDGIGFVVQASLARLTIQQKYIYDLIFSIFGSDVVKNIFIMVTFADGGVPSVIAAIQETKIECSKYYKFNNSALFAVNKKLTKELKEEDVTFNEMFWKMSSISLQRFFQAFRTVSGVSPYFTKEVLRERKQLETTLEALRQQITRGCVKMEELRKREIVHQQIEAEIAANKKFTNPVEIQKQRKVNVPTGQYVTNCLICHFTCHIHCDYADDRDKYKCSVMNGSGKENAFCTACPNKCFWNRHVNNPYRFELYSEIEERTSKELQEKYKSALQEKCKIENTIEQINCDLQKLETAVAIEVAELQRVLQRLNKITLKQSPLTQVPYLKLLIDVEMQQAKPGFQQRIKMYEHAKQAAELLEKAKHDPQSIRIQKKKEEIEKTGQGNSGVHPYLTKEVIKERKSLEATVEALQQQIRAGCTKLEELRQEEIILQQREAIMAANKDFTYTVDIEKQRKIDLPTGQYVTNCLTCNITCHDNCSYADDKDKYRCSAMDDGGQSNAHCTVCPNKCFWQQHVNNPYRFEIYTVTEERTSENLHKKYKTALQGKNKVEKMVQQLNYYLQTVENDLISKVTELEQALQRLNKISLKQSSLTQVQHINLLIEAEKQQAKPGFQQRIKFYEHAKQEAEILERAKRDPESLLISIRKKTKEESNELSKNHLKPWYTSLKFW